MDKTSIVDSVICSGETMLQHAELYHYTSAEAFEGIITSQSFWCFHFSEMRDRNEVQLLRGELVAALAPRMDEIVNRLDRKTRRIWDKSGGGTTTSRDLINSLYGATFDGVAAYSALDPYLFSFSTHAEDPVCVREHGIRSQWDSYAGGEGYCLVFDTREVAELLVQEWGERYWVKLTLAPVRYFNESIASIFPELVRHLADTLDQFLRGDRAPELPVEAFLEGATLFKGAAYQSERELRIVAIPGTRALVRHAQIEHPDEFDATKPLPDVKTHASSGKRYVALFDGLNLRLPIKRIIVGPGGCQPERLARARRLVGNIPVTVAACL